MFNLTKLIKEEMVFTFNNSVEIRIEKILINKSKTFYINYYYYQNKIINETDFDCRGLRKVHRNLKNAKMEAMEAIKKIVEKLGV